MASPAKSLPTFPLVQFAPLLSVHTLALVFTALFLPRSTYLFSPIPPQASSKDKPQHPFLRALTADPTLTLTWICIGVAAVQASWASRMRTEVDNARIQLFGENEEARVKRAMKSGSEKFQTLKDAVISTLACSVFIHVILVLFGAPIIEHFLKTFLLATLLSLLTVYPTVYTLRSPSFSSNGTAHRLTWIRLFAELSPRTAHERLLVYPFVGTAVGAWIGVFPIALDWDRPWQAWPLTPAYGALVGHIIGSWVALLHATVLYLVEVDKRAETEKSVEQAVSTTGKKANSKKPRRKAQ